jgi:hypothetical protein
MHIIDEVLQREEFIKRPPVLVDIGASGKIHQKWRRIAPYSICIAFDADDREFGYAVHEAKGYRKLYLINRVVTDNQTINQNFYLTKSPFCSSILKPYKCSLDKWVFGGLFDVEQVATLEAVSLPSVMQTLGIDKIDWFKTDSQGTDLRLFRSLGDERIRRVLIAEFEPGIIDAYEGEDKIRDLMTFIDSHNFWMSDLQVRGTQRLSRKIFESHFTSYERRLLGAVMKASPAWGEVTYMNTFPVDADYLDKRDFLLGWIFAVLEKQFGFALELSLLAAERFNDQIFAAMQSHTRWRIKMEYCKLPLCLAHKAIALMARIAG